MTLEIAWTLGPALILLFISIPTVRLIFRTQPRNPEPATSCPITVVAHQWWWEFHYDDGSNVMTANELHIPADRPIRFSLVSNDVIHSFDPRRRRGPKVVQGDHLGAELRNSLTLVARVSRGIAGCDNFDLA